MAEVVDTVVPSVAPASVQRLRAVVRGAVQGVGFRPFIYRLATELGLRGWVNNSSSGVFLEVEGPRNVLRSFLFRLESEKPAVSFIQSLECSYLDSIGYASFEIRASEDGEKTTIILPDIATCPECLREIFDKSNRRYRYPFTNCTHCGPRFSIIERLPYDRQATSMKRFVMCPACAAEYEDPRDRRFHAQPNACPVCGPNLELWTSDGRPLVKFDDALLHAAGEIRRGNIVAVKGLGGFHLVADARSEDAVRRLRMRKHREAKPFALMYPDLAMIRRDCEVSDSEERLLCSPESPIVLLWQRPGSGIRVAPAVAPGNPYLGVMLPYTPLHHLLMSELGFPVVATSGNLSDETICTDEHEAVRRLRGIADFFLVHNRPIVHHVDDSVARIVLDRELILRRARGFAPLPVIVDENIAPTLAVGAHQKNSVALSIGRQVFVSQHIGDLDSVQSLDAFERVIASFRDLYEVAPVAVVCDLHPNYVSTGYAHRNATSPLRVQHHYAHVLSCMAENAISPPVLGVAWDGSGYGLDKTIWGGEFLTVDGSGFERVAHLRTFRLPGAEQAVREPRRSAVGMLYAMLGEEIFDRNDLLSVQAFTPAERKVVRQMLRQGLNSPVTSSAGRVFDVVASLVGLRQFVRFEGQAAMELEFAAVPEMTDEAYTINHTHDPREPMTISWARMVIEILDDQRAGVPLGRIARKFHNAMADSIVHIAQHQECERIALSGGCFQNRLLTELAVNKLRAAGFHVYWHQRIPPNDGGIALGQIMAAARSSRKEE